MSHRLRIIAVVIAIGLALIAIFMRGFYTPPNSPPVGDVQNIGSEGEELKIISTNPKDGGTILPTQSLEITFNQPMVIDMGKIVIDGFTDFRLEQSGNHKTLKVTPNKSFELGRGYVLTIKKDYATDNDKKLRDDFNLNFRTIEYKGL